MLKYGFRDNFVIIDDGRLSDCLYIQFSRDMTEIMSVIDQPECDVPSFVFDKQEISCWAYIQAWFRKQSLFEHQKNIQIRYPKLNISDDVKVTRENLHKWFGEYFLQSDSIDQEYINNLHYIQD